MSGMKRIPCLLYTSPELPDFRFSIDPASGDLTVSDGMTTTNLGQVVGSISLENGVFYYTTSKGKTEIEMCIRDRL